MEQLVFPGFGTDSHRLLAPQYTEYDLAILNMCSYCCYQYPPTIKPRDIAAWKSICFIFSSARICDQIYHQVLHQTHNLLIEYHELNRTLVLKNGLKVYYMSVQNLNIKLSGRQFDLVMSSCELDSNEISLVNCALRA